MLQKRSIDKHAQLKISFGGDFYYVNKTGWHQKLGRSLHLEEFWLPDFNISLYDQKPKHRLWTVVWEEKGTKHRHIQEGRELDRSVSY